jgi:hypothetical protein
MIGGTCGTYERKNLCRLLWRYGERDDLEDLDVDRTVIIS